MSKDWKLKKRRPVRKKVVLPLLNELSNTLGLDIDIQNALTAKTNKPKFIIANTIKGKGVSFMENEVVWHYRSANEEELCKGLKELEE